MASFVTRIARLRKFLLLTLVVGIAALGGLFLFGRMGKQPVRPAANDEAAQAAEGTTLIGQDFDYTFTDKERPVFRIRGDSIRVDQNQTIFLDKVGLTLYDEEGHEYHVESKQASFNQGQNEGRLQGDVFLRGPGNLELRTAQLQLRDKGQTLFCPRVVQMRYAKQYMARADRLRVFLPQDMYLLVGQVRVNSLPGAEKPVSLVAQRVVYERKARLLRVEGKAELRHGTDFLKALRITSYLSADESSIVFVRGLWDVTGRAVARDQEAGSNTTVDFAGKDLSVLMEPEGNQVRQVDLQGTPRAPAKIETTGAGVTRVLTSQRLEGVLGDRGVLTSAEGFGGVVLRETGLLRAPRRGSPPAQGTRQARGQHANAGFAPDGRISTVSLDQNVSYQDGEVGARGDRAVVNMENGQGEFFGSPVEVVSDRGRVTGPRILYNQKEQLVSALGGVRAVLEQDSETALSGTPLGRGGEGPVHVEAREALWRQSPSAFLFRGDVRAWRGENLLLAPELLGDNEKNQLNANGGVKSLWMPSPEQARKTSGSAAKKAGKPAPIEVTSNQMVYVDPRPGTKGTLTYTGNVRVLQEGKTLTCEKLDVELGPDKQAETMSCDEKAHLKDPATGRDIEGQRALYHLDQRQIEMFGAPLVTMRDREGNVVQGRRLLYFIDDGKVEVKGGEAPPAPSSPGPSKAAPGTGTGG